MAGLLSTDPSKFSEYVLNHPTFWNDAKLTDAPDDDDEETEAATQRLSADLVDLDVAILSTVEKLDAPASEIATLLDEALKSSLWRRTLARHEQLIQTVERDVLISRATWLWRRTTTAQRTALYASGLGTAPGLFLDDHREELIDSLAQLHSAFLVAAPKTMQVQAVRFAKIVLGHSFFGVRALPDAWESVLESWISGVPASEILGDRTGHDANRLQVFLQDALAFKLVWAAEAVRVQAIAVAHARANELGEGPALAFTYGVGNHPAALLCQMGLPSRTAALWAAEKTKAQFRDSFGAKLWLVRHEQLLETRDFWSTSDQHLLWTRFASRGEMDVPREWKQLEVLLDVNWTQLPPPPGTFLRVAPRKGGTGLVCASSLWPMGSVSLPFDCTNWHLEATSTVDSQLRIGLYGPATHAIQ